MPKPSLANPPRRHHYVPQFYMKKFAGSDEYLSMYDRQTGKYASVHPKNICYVNDLYTTLENGQPNADMEKVWFEKIDGDAARSIRNFEDGRAPDDEQRASFAVFMGQQVMRNPDARKMATDSRQQVMDEMVRFWRKDPAILDAAIARYAESGKPVMGMNAESFLADLDNGKFRIAITEAPFIQQLVRSAKFLGEELFYLDWEILKAPESGGFITCDYPFLLIPSAGNPTEFGLRHPGTIKYFPITRSLCLRMGDAGGKFRYRDASRYEVRVINQNVAVNSERFILGRDRDHLQVIISRSGTGTVDAVPRHSLLRLPQSDLETVFGVQFWPRRNFYHL